MLRKDKIKHFRSIRKEQNRLQEEYIGWLRMRAYLLKMLMKSDMEQKEQTTQGIQETLAI